MTATVAGWIAYAAERGDTITDDAASAAALKRGEDYIRARYVIRFSEMYDGTEPEVDEATYIAAKEELATPGFWSTTFTPSEARVLTRVDAIQWTPVSSGVSGRDAFAPVSTMIENLLLPFTRDGAPAVFVA
ncbi:MAG: hypothetical protein RQ750_13305 [Roseovarius sp.]|nr:hypothetical protein [Roseovarius sp.]